MSEEFIPPSRNKLKAITRPAGNGTAYPLTTDLHAINVLFRGLLDYTEQGLVDAVDAYSDQGRSVFLNDRILRFDPKTLDTKVRLAISISDAILQENKGQTKAEAAEIFSLMYHLLNSENPEAALAKQTYEKVFAALELGPILPAADVLVPHMGGGLSDMQRKAQKNQGTPEV